MKIPGSTAVHVRSLPLTCICLWDYAEQRGRWDLVKRLPGCPWHEGS